jgi:hypothetical protein
VRLRLIREREWPSETAAKQHPLKSVGCRAAFSTQETLARAHTIEPLKKHNRNWRKASFRKKKGSIVNKMHEKAKHAEVRQGLCACQCMLLHALYVKKKELEEAVVVEDAKSIDTLLFLL